MLLPLAKKLWMSCKNSSINWIFTDQVLWITKRLFHSKTGTFKRNSAKKQCLASEDQIISFISRERVIKYGKEIQATSKQKKCKNFINAFF